MKQAYDLYHVYHGQLAEVDARVEAYLPSFEDQSQDQTRPEPKRNPKRNEPTFDISNLFYRMTGVDLTAIDGIGAHWR